MAKIFDESTRIVPTWMAASRHLLTRTAQQREDRNLVLEIHDPLTVTPDERIVIETIDKAIRTNKPDLSIETVAGTIFPQGLYQRYGRPDFYDHYLKIMARAKKPGTWGTYAMRLMSRGAGTSMINPLEIIVGKLKFASTDGKPYRSVYEAGFIDPVTDLGDSAMDFGCELPTYDPMREAKPISNMPCLSHLSFKLTAATTVDLTAIYRSHYYCERALGNLLGLSRLLSFVAKEAELKIGTLTCVSTHARLDVGSWGGVARATELLKPVP